MATTIFANGNLPTVEWAMGTSITAHGAQALLAVGVRCAPMELRIIELPDGSAFAVDDRGSIDGKSLNARAVAIATMKAFARVDADDLRGNVVFLSADEVKWLREIGLVRS